MNWIVSGVSLRLEEQWFLKWWKMLNRLLVWRRRLLRVFTIELLLVLYLLLL